MQPLPIWSDKIDLHEEAPIIVPYMAEQNPARSAVIICPGGGYRMRAWHEGEPVAEWLNTLGITAFVLHYRVNPAKHLEPLADAQRAIRYVRYHAEEWGIDPDKIGLLGFSAGGHLAACAANMSDYPAYKKIDRIDSASCRPDIAILCYPVITMLEHTHEGSLTCLLGENPKHEARELLSMERHVSKDTPPSFLWHTADDQSVPVINSLLYANQLSTAQIPYELHVFQNGRHGLGLAEEEPDAAKWTGLCASWLSKQGFCKA
ncbi:esterase [Bacillus sp. FJAT-27916]|uniref:alpha/beta hydrolase n=1 Tax=Bacillus sp. FJAT-27916 TaxID=1679169 RepID=UPI000670EF2D|nr:alpha/beta hydrolase [Bacillus sp. FJAT-27916]KMY43979.1 esterase [Bacillus sp. FJAT-27916]